MQKPPDPQGGAAFFQADGLVVAISVAHLTQVKVAACKIAIMKENSRSDQRSALIRIKSELL